MINILNSKGEQISLDPNRDLLGKGGEGSVYSKGKKAYKIYHPEKTKMPENKISELGSLTEPFFLKPEAPIYSLSGREYIGFEMKKGPTNYEFLSRYLKKSIRKKNAVSPKTFVGLVELLRDNFVKTHCHEGVLIVDANENNFLVSSDLRTIYHIDVDSYKTKSYPPTALMESVRDRMVVNNNFTKDSDWFSWAILAFQLYTASHPYKGCHPDYNRNKWLEMMDANISVFSPDCKMPPASVGTDNIPDAHLKYFKDVFLNSHRGEPPAANSTIPVTRPKPQQKLAWSNESFDIKGVLNGTVEGSVSEVFSQNGLHLACSEKGAWDIRSGKRHTKSSNSLSKSYIVHFKDILCCEGGKEIFQNPMNGLGQSEPRGVSDRKTIYQEGAGKVFKLNDRFFSLKTDSSVVCHNFDYFGDKMVHSIREAGRIGQNGKAFQNCFLTDLMGTTRLSFAEEDKLRHVEIKALNNHRIIDAKYDKGFFISISEKSGNYYKTCIKGENTLQEKSDLDDVNFTVLDNGLCISVTEDRFVEAFFKIGQVKRFKNPPFDSSCQLFSIGNDLLFEKNGGLYSAKSKSKPKQK